MRRAIERLRERLRLRLRGMQGSRSGHGFADECIGRMAGAWHAGNLREACEWGGKGLALAPDSPDLLYMTGACHFDSGRYSEALAFFEHAARFAHAYPLVLFVELHEALAAVRAGQGVARLPAVPAPPHPTRTSIVICSIDDAKFRAVAGAYEELFSKQPHEILRIPDARSLAEGYNRGLERSQGETILFSHDDVRIATPDFAERVLSHLAQHDLVGIAGSDRLAGPSWLGAGWPHQAGQIGMEGTAAPGSINVTAYGSLDSLAHRAQALDGVMMAVRRPLAERLRFDAATFDGWHLYDIDFSFRAALSGASVVVADDLLVVHASTGGYRSDAWQTHAARFMQKFEGRVPPMEAGQPELVSIGVSSAEEWQALTATRLARRRKCSP
jgi:hypothetical protein